MTRLKMMSTRLQPYEKLEQLRRRYVTRRVSNVVRNSDEVGQQAIVLQLTTHLSLPPGHGLLSEAHVRAGDGRWRAVSQQHTRRNFEPRARAHAQHSLAGKRHPHLRQFAIPARPYRFYRYEQANLRPHGTCKEGIMIKISEYDPNLVADIVQFRREAYSNSGRDPSQLRPVER